MTMLNSICCVLGIFLTFHFQSYIVGYTIQSRYAEMNYRFATVSYSELKLWRFFCMYPHRWQKKDAYLLTIDIERLSMLHYLLDILLVPLAHSFCILTDLNYQDIFVILLIMDTVPFVVVILIFYMFGQKVTTLSSKPVIQPIEKKKYIRRCVRQYPEEQFSVTMREEVRKTLFWKITNQILCVADNKTGALVSEQVILRDSKYRYLSESITTFIKPKT